MNIYPDQHIGGLPGPADWTMTVGVEGLGEGTFYDIRGGGDPVLSPHDHRHLGRRKSARASGGQGPSVDRRIPLATTQWRNNVRRLEVASSL